VGHASMPLPCVDSAVVPPSSPPSIPTTRPVVNELPPMPSLLFFSIDGDRIFPAGRASLAKLPCRPSCTCIRGGQRNCARVALVHTGAPVATTTDSAATSWICLPWRSCLLEPDEWTTGSRPPPSHPRLLTNHPTVWSPTRKGVGAGHTNGTAGCIWWRPEPDWPPSTARVSGRQSRKGRQRPRLLWG
jgi:hypothetical protein